MNATAMNTALSGLQAASTRLNVSANNVANAASTSGEVYKAQRVEQTSVQEGGVKAQVQPKTPATVQYFDQNNAAANEEGVAEYPNVSLEEEVINQQIAGYDFKANLSVIRTADEMLGNLLDMTA